MGIVYFSAAIVCWRSESPFYKNKLMWHSYFMFRGLQNNIQYFYKQYHTKNWSQIIAISSIKKESQEK